MNREIRTLILGLVGVPCLLALLTFAVYGKDTGRIMAFVWGRAPTLLTGSPHFQSFSGGFAANVIISLWAIVIAGVAGVLLGSGLISQSASLRIPSSLIMNVLRNSPWLVLLYAMLYLLPFEVDAFGHTFELSPLVKAVIGLALPILANIAEVFRGGVEAIPSGQWESARSLGYRRRQILRHVIVPQAIPLMTPNLMTIYAMLLVGTSLAVVTGTDDVISIGRTIIATEGDRYATAIYIFILFLFFVSCFPIAIFARWLERRVGIRQS